VVVEVGGWKGWGCEVAENEVVLEAAENEVVLEAVETEEALSAGELEKKRVLVLQH
jgi:hypothetical protein